MDDRRIDILAKSFAGSRPSRRGVLAGLSGAVLLALPGRQEAAAQCVAPGKKCKRKRGKAKKCCGGAKCQGKRCECRRNRAACGKTCCKKNEICAGGQCQPGAGTCPTSGEDWCNGGFSAICNGDPNCHCFRTTAGATRCGIAAGNFCACTTDAECVAADGPGAFCVRTAAPNCPATCTGVGDCFVPCPSQG